MNKKIIKYECLREFKLLPLVDLVNEAIANGWQPLGSMFQIKEEYEIFLYAQTMVKYEE